MRLRGIDSIRGVLALSVASAHAYGHLTGWTSDLGPIKAAGFAVDVFFAISAIVLIEAYYSKYRSTRGGWWSFLALRLARLWPLYLLSTALIPGVFWAAGESIPPWVLKDVAGGLLPNALMVTSIGGQTWQVINHPAFSVSVEFWVGSAFILLCFWQLRAAAIAVAAVSLVAVLLLHVSPEAGENVTSAWFTVSALRCLFGMAVGLLMFQAIGQRPLPRLLDNAICVAGVFVIAAELLTPANNSAALYVLALIVVAAAISRIPANEDINRALEAPVLRSLGRLSYSIYLMHVPVICAMLTYTDWRGPAAANIAVALTVGVAYFTYTYVEAPCIAGMHRWLEARAALTDLPTREADVSAP